MFAQAWYVFKIVSEPKTVWQAVEILSYHLEAQLRLSFFVFWCVFLWLFAFEVTPSQMQPASRSFSLTAVLFPSVSTHSEFEKIWKAIFAFALGARLKVQMQPSTPPIQLQKFWCDFGASLLRPLDRHVDCHLLGSAKLGGLVCSKVQANILWASLSPKSSLRSWNGMYRLQAFPWCPHVTVLTICWILVVCVAVIKSEVK